MSNEEQLQRLRARIDELDTQLVEMISTRGPRRDRARAAGLLNAGPYSQA